MSFYKLDHVLSEKPRHAGTMRNQCIKSTPQYKTEAYESIFFKASHFNSRNKFFTADLLKHGSTMLKLCKSCFYNSIIDTKMSVKPSQYYSIIWGFDVHCQSKKRGKDQ